MSRIKLYTVGQLAERTGITVRTLHHYDEIGLLAPATRGSSGRRLYDREAVLRLQQILTYRTLGLALEDIARILDDPEFDRRTALLEQRKVLGDQISKNEALIRGIDEALAIIGHSSKKEMDMKTLFGGFDPQLFEDEAKALWGGTEAWATATRRTENYTQDDWAKYHAAHEKLCTSFAELAASGTRASSATAAEHADAYAALISDWFYPCDAAHLGHLADMYDADDRFRTSFDRFGSGTAEFVIAAFRARSAR